MPDSFQLEVDTSRGQRVFDAELRTFGYTHKIAVVVDEMEVLFEPDEERNYRAVMPEYGAVLPKGVNIELLQAIAHELEKNFK